MMHAMPSFFGDRWSLANELGLVVVALYQRSLQLHYVEALVDSIKRVRQKPQLAGSKMLLLFTKINVENAVQTLVCFFEGREVRDSTLTTEVTLLGICISWISI